jgi:uncharacterized lipoprotein NlpE involved in copper resistance
MIISIAALLTIINACSNTEKTAGHSNSEKISTAGNSRNSLDWAGAYKGTLPCADCEGIETEIRLNGNLTYEITTKYLGKSEDLFFSNGKFNWDESGNKIILEEEYKQSIIASHFQVGENKLIVLDSEGNKITSTLPADTYVLRKEVFDNNIVEKYWKLIELQGNKISFTGNEKKEPHLILRAKDNRAAGNGGCNTFNGTYELSEGNRIRFSKMASTLMACPDVNYEAEYLKIFEMADNYSLKNDTLSLNRARMAPLAKFVVVYLR